MMRILFVTPYIPSLVRVRPYNFLKALVERGHEVTLLALQPPGDVGEALPQLRAWCRAVIVVPQPRRQTIWNGLKALPGQMPLQAAYSCSPHFDRVARDLVARQTFDGVHVEHLRGAVLADSLDDLPIVFDSVDSIALLFQKVLKDAPGLKSRLIARLDLARTRRFEGQLTRRFEEVILTSAADRAALIELGSDSDHVTVVPNGVDLDYFQPQTVDRARQTLVFTGKMSYHANIAAAEDLVNDIMPLVWAQQPDVQLQIVGKDPAPVIQMLGEQPNITVTGFVPDMRPYLAAATLAVSTVRYGVGIQNKVLEAMAMATPVICSPQACSALQTRTGHDLLVGDDPQAIARHILDLLASPEKQATVGAAGRRYVERYQTWDRAAALLEELYTRAARRCVVEGG